jgi:hypothetical protein
MALGHVSLFHDVFHRGEVMAAISDIPDREEGRG